VLGLKHLPYDWASGRGESPVLHRVISGKNDFEIAKAIGCWDSGIPTGFDRAEEILDQRSGADGVPG
jgi:hypothetical protein